MGGIQAQKADIEQRKAETGLNIVPRIQNPRHGRSSSRNGQLARGCCYQRNELGSIPRFRRRRLQPIFLPVAIDPLMVAAAGKRQRPMLIKIFPPIAGSRRADDAAPDAEHCRHAGSANFTPNLPLADAIFRAADDVVIDPGSRRAQTAVGSYDPSHGQLR